MTRDDIIKLARQHGKPVQEQNAEVEYVFTLEGIDALLAAEREACAKVCDAEVIALGNGSREGLVAGICAAAIRARSTTREMSPYWKEQHE